MPFCSIRCKEMDICRWLDEDYGLPVEPNEDEFDDEATSA